MRPSWSSGPRVGLQVTSMGCMRAVRRIIIISPRSAPHTVSSISTRLRMLTMRLLLQLMLLLLALIRRLLAAGHCCRRWRRRLLLLCLARRVAAAGAAVRGGWSACRLPRSCGTIVMCMGATSLTMCLRGRMVCAAPTARSRISVAALHPTSLLTLLMEFAAARHASLALALSCASLRRMRSSCGALLLMRSTSRRRTA